jgi:hypothetical protein
MVGPTRLSPLPARRRTAFVLFAIIALTFAASFTALSKTNTDQVAFNVEKHKVHKLSCHWAHRCTKNCIVIKRSEAYNRGGVPCKVCGG